MRNVKVNELREMFGKKISSIEGLELYSSEVVFRAADGSWFKFFHVQDCCESVSVEDICGEVADLQDAIIISAEEIFYDSEDLQADLADREFGDSSHTWTFYRYITDKGVVTVRWLGESNGYYSECVDYTFHNTVSVE